MIRSNRRRGVVLTVLERVLDRLPRAGVIPGLGRRRSWNGSLIPSGCNDCPVDLGTGISAVTLDAHGVLLLPDPAVLRQALKPFGVEPDDEACWRAHFEMIRLIDQTAEPDWPGIHRAMAAALGVPAERQVDAAPAAVDAYLTKQWVAAPGAADALARLESSGFSLAVIANSPHGNVEDWLADAGLCGTSGPLPRVACVLDSQLLGFGKPDRQIFELALTALDAVPSQCAHVGDSLASDILGAQAVGITPVHVDPCALCDSTDHVHTDSLAEFAGELLR